MCPAVKLLAVLGAVAAAGGYQHCITPKITVPGAIRDKLHNHHIRQPTFEVFCSSENNEIIIDVNNSEKIKTEIINATTIKAVVETKATKILVKCRRTNFINNNCWLGWWISVNKYPTIKQFQCFTNDFLFLHCSWISDFYYGNYFLSLTERNGEFLTRVCNGRINSNTHYSCSWDLSNLERPDRYKVLNGSTLLFPLPLHLQVCNAFECVNQTNKVDLFAATILNVPEIMNIRAHGTDGAILEWRVPDDGLIFQSYLGIHYLVEYWFSDIQHSVKISKTTTAQRYKSISTQLIFPCPGKQYRVRISCRPSTAPPKYMSDFGYTSFETAADPGAPADPACHFNPVEVNPHVMVYNNELRRREIKKELDKPISLRCA